ncbi:MAG: SDR family NAD(P)-dependent oxidoreductase, partial [Caulobacteraceae bacterium]|nr:SDR family NAD(P)-dependent oxidoreductase [Caulobacteraceae bacterium]
MTRPDRVAIVTGAGKGLGRAYALALAATGVAVVVNNRWTDRSQPSSAASVVEEIGAAGGLAVASLEAAEAPDAGAAMVALALEHFGRLDAVVANAGIASPTRFHRETPQAFRALMDINFYGTLSLIEAAWPILSAAPAGRVIVSASSAGLHGGHGLVSYSASKAALIGLVRSLAIEGKTRHLLVNAIAPYAATAMTGQDL